MLGRSTVSYGKFAIISEYITVSYGKFTMALKEITVSHGKFTVTLRCSAVILRRSTVISNSPG